MFSIPQILDLLFVHAEVVSDLVQEGEADLVSDRKGIGKIAQQWLGEESDLVGQERRLECGAFGEGSAFVEAVERIRLRIETHGLEMTFFWFFLDHDLHIVQTAAKLLGEPLQNPDGLLLKFFRTQ